MSKFLDNLKLYLKDVCPREWTEEEKDEYVNGIVKGNVVSIKKMGTLSQKDLQNGGVVWM